MYPMMPQRTIPGGQRLAPWATEPEKVYNQPAPSNAGTKHLGSATVLIELGRAADRLAVPRGQRRSGAAHRPVLGHPHDRIGWAPDFPGFVYRSHPNEIMLLAVVDHGNRIARALSDYLDGDGRIKLRKHRTNLLRLQRLTRRMGDMFTDIALIWVGR